MFPASTAACLWPGDDNTEFQRHLMIAQSARAAMDKNAATDAMKRLANKEAAEREHEAHRVEVGLELRLAQAEERRRRHHQHRCGDLECTVPPAQPADRERHHRQQLHRLEHGAGRVVEVTVSHLAEIEAKQEAELLK